MAASACAVLLRPTGLAPTPAAPPRVNLLDRMPFTLRSSISSMMTSVSEPPIWNPKLPPSMRSAPGAPQPPPAVRHTRNPRPYLAPTMNAPCLTPGTTTTQCAFLRRSSGIPLSGAARTSCRTVADSLSRSEAVSASRLVDAIPRHNNRLSIRRMFDPRDHDIATPQYTDNGATHISSTCQAEEFLKRSPVPRHPAPSDRRYACVDS